nr:MAG TPA: hypothetical protein [Caudoviricetes sp.]
MQKKTPEGSHRVALRWRAELLQCMSSKLP